MAETPDERADRLAMIAIGLVSRVREDDPQANRRWLHAMTSEQDREALLYVLAAAVPTDQSWASLTAWARQPGGPDTPEAIEERRRVLTEAMAPRRTAA